jgi:hypothetical protein
MSRVLLLKYKVLHLGLCFYIVLSLMFITVHLSFSEVLNHVFFNVANMKAITPYLLFNHQNTLKKMHRIVCCVKCFTFVKKNIGFFIVGHVKKSIRMCATYQFEFNVCTVHY